MDARARELENARAKMAVEKLIGTTTTRAAARDESDESDDGFEFARVEGVEGVASLERGIGVRDEALGAIARARAAAARAREAARALGVGEASASPGEREAKPRSPRSPLGPPRRVLMPPPPLKIPESSEATRVVVDSARSLRSARGTRFGAREDAFWDVTRDHDRTRASLPLADRQFRRSETRDSDETTLRKLFRIAAAVEKRSRVSGRRAKAFVSPAREELAPEDVREVVSYLSSPQKARASRHNLKPRL